jgi:sugar lactone lactonase YvrE
MKHSTDRVLPVAATLALLFVMASVAVAGSTRSFVIDDDGAFGKGELDGTSVYSSGSVRLGASTERVDIAGSPVAWSALRRPDGSVLLGTGNDGKILRVDGKKVSTFAETKQLLVTTLVAGPGGDVFAGTLPDAKIFRVDAAGKAKEFAKLDGAEHIWALLWDAKKNALVAATGPNGKLFRVPLSGKAEVLYDGDAAHLMSLARDKDGALYVGTSNTAQVIRVTEGKPAETVYDFPGTEITALAVQSGELLVAANAFDEGRGGGAADDAKDSKKKDVPAGPKSGDGQIWRVSAAGVADRVFELKKDFFTEVAFDADGAFFAATGKDGKVIRVLADRSFSTWLDLNERQVLAFELSGPAPYVVASDSAALYWVKTAGASKGLWTSEVLDGGARSRFGELTWRASGEVSMETRSGNTEKPDATWSAWSAPLSAAGPVRSPAARYLQIRAKITNPNTALFAVTAYYLRDNQRAVIESLGVEVRGADKDKDGAAPPKASSVYKLTWKVENPDGDPLRYYLRFRSEGQRTLRSILPPQQILTQTTYDWETNSIPDGFYVVELEASDELTNPRELASSTKRSSEPILIDNHAPVIDALAVEGDAVRGRATDSLGPIQKLEYAVNGGPWTVFFPEDDLFDTRTESFRFTVPKIGPDPIVAVRATDAAGNTATREVVSSAR